MFRGCRRGFKHTHSLTPKGYTYIGHCRCGIGPNAYYQDTHGRIHHYNEIIHQGEDDFLNEIETLKKENEELKKRIEELEKNLHKKQ